jgi:hypothetical protein
MWHDIDWYYSQIKNFHTLDLLEWYVYNDDYVVHLFASDEKLKNVLQPYWNRSTKWLDSCV